MSELPTSWALSKLGDLCEVVSGSTPRTTVPEYWGGEVAWITPDDLSGYSRKTIANGARNITQTGYDSCSTRLVPAGTVLFTSRAPIGYVAIASQPVCTNQGFKSFVPNEALTSDYLYWFLKHAALAIRNLGSGTTFPELSKTRAKEVAIPVAPLAEQRRIVAAIEEHFSRLDAADQSLQLARRKLDALRRSVLARAVEGDWPVWPFEKLLVSLRNGIFVSRPAAEPPGIPIFRISAVRPLALAVDDVRFADIDPEKANGFFVEQGDLLFTRYSGNADYVGACAFVSTLPRPTLHPDKLIRAVVERSAADPAFIAIALSTGSGRKAIEERRKTTAGQVGIAGSELKKVPVPVPPLGEQRRIVAEVERQLSLIDVMVAQINVAVLRSAALRRSILKQAFTGELVPQDPSDEPASVLLERIPAGNAAARKPSRRKRKIPA
jgi:type I restriction enzyme S subunit